MADDIVSRNNNYAELVNLPGIHSRPFTVTYFFVLQNLLIFGTGQYWEQASIKDLQYAISFVKALTWRIWSIYKIL